MAIAELTTTTDELPPGALAEVVREERMFQLAQRKAAVYAKSSLVPKDYQNNIGNVLIAENMARRMGADTLMVMQNLYVVHGRPAWSSQFLIATFNSCGRFSAIRYRMSGTPGQPGSSCVAFSTELATGEVLSGTTVTWEMAKAEGWVDKSGSKWKTMPEQMFRYRAAAFLIRTIAPEIGMGLLTREETEDMVIEGVSSPAKPSITSLDGLTAKLTGETTSSETEPIEKTTEQATPPAAVDSYAAYLAELNKADSITAASAVYDKWFGPDSAVEFTPKQQTDAVAACDAQKNVIRGNRGANSNKS